MSNRDKMLLCMICIVVLLLFVSTQSGKESSFISVDSTSSSIKWVDFNVPLPAMEKALDADIDSYGNDIQINWVEVLSYLAAKYGGNWSQYKEKDMTTLLNKLNDGTTTIVDLTQNMKHYSHYFQSYDAVLGGFVGNIRRELPDKESVDGKKVADVYGLRVFSPIAEGYGYSHYDDFGTARSYGYRREHKGNDLVGSIGTPIAAVESGYVEQLGWNIYGGWRIGIRSFDGKRYYYYAHLRKNKPFNRNLSEGSFVKAGDIIGYLGMTGYSNQENTNNMTIPHLHFGMQLIFDESQKDKNEIWIDVYHIVQLLSRNRVTVEYDAIYKEYNRKYNVSIDVTRRVAGGYVAAAGHYSNLRK